MADASSSIEAWLTAFESSMRRLSDSEQRTWLRQPEAVAFFTKVFRSLNQWPREAREPVLDRLKAISPAVAAHISNHKQLLS